MSFKGIPAVYIHSLLATPNDTVGVERTGLTRAVNRRQWDRGELEALMSNHQSETGRVFQAYRRLLKIRKCQHAFHPDAPQTVLDLANGLFGLHRIALDGGQQIICLFNCSPKPLQIDLDVLPEDIRHWQELIGEVNTEFRADSLVMPPYAAFWFSDEPQA